MKTSADEGKTWSSPRDCTFVCPLAYRVLNNARIVRLKSGRVLIPLAEHRTCPEGGDKVEGSAHLFCLYSDDDCATWKMSEYVPHPPRHCQQEPGVIELKDGRVMMWYRTGEGRQWQAFSADAGQTWSAPEPSAMYSPCSPATIVRLKSGQLLGVWNDHENRTDLMITNRKGRREPARTPLTIGLSSDDGRTWPRRRNLEDGFDQAHGRRYWYCYTAVLELDDRLLIAYCAENGLSDSRITSVPLDWVSALPYTAGKPDEVVIDFAVAEGKMKALHGVNNSPVRLMEPNGWMRDPRGQWEFAEAGIPYVRLHDSVGAYGGTHYVDIPNIFPNFDADENDPKNYDFTLTDAYLKPLVKAGCIPFYRLGVTIEPNAGIKAYNVFPPKDYAKWARICEHVIRHYNEGWADGFKWNLQYWEIWNEPDGHGTMWRGTQQQFFEFYCTAASYLKACFPQLKFGGFGSVGFYAVDQPDNKVWGVNTKFNSAKWAEEFIRYMSEKKAPLDFFSWHVYIRNGFGPDRIGVHARHARQLLDKYGFEMTESFLDEWNVIEDVNMTGHKDKDWDGLKEMKSGASVAAAFAVMQKAPLDKAMYYDGAPHRAYCGLFYSPSGRTTPCYETFKAFNELYRLGTAVKAASADKEVYALAAKGDNACGFYLVNISAKATKTVLPKVFGASGVFAMRRLDATHPKLTDTGKWHPGDSVSLPPNSLVLFLR